MLTLHLHCLSCSVLLISSVSSTPQFSEFCSECNRGCLPCYPVPDTCTTGTSRHKFQYFTFCCHKMRGIFRASLGSTCSSRTREARDVRPICDIDAFHFILQKQSRLITTIHTNMYVAIATSGRCEDTNKCALKALTWHSRHRR